MTLNDALNHLDYLKTVKPEVYKDLGVTDKITDTMIEEAAELATQTHWGAPEISLESLFNKNLKRIIENTL